MNHMEHLKKIQNSLLQRRDHEESTKIMGDSVDDIENQIEVQDKKIIFFDKKGISKKQTTLDLEKVILIDFIKNADGVLKRINRKKSENFFENFLIFGEKCLSKIFAY